MESAMQEDDKWFRAAFSVHSLRYTPEQLETMVGIKATSKHYVGDPVSSRSLHPQRTENYYCIESGCSEEEPMERHLNVLLSLLDSKKSVIGELLKTENVRFFCGFSSGNGQGGFALAPELLSRLAAFGVPLILDLYPPSEISDVQ